mmetsp:Transcript_43182/g.98455  ORF Transcript_43182/g.98455 Transcript_43182/m.98455 type:complete len:320 (+) Transcript_43182:2-961(+)
MDLGFEPRQPGQKAILKSTLATAGHGSMAFHSLVKFLMDYYDHTYSACFHQADADNSGLLDPAEVQNMIYVLGFLPDPQRVQQLIKEHDPAGVGVSRDDVSKLMAKHREHHLLVWQESAGFSEGEIGIFKSHFLRMDKKSNGFISMRECMGFLETTGRQPTNKEEQESLIRLFARMDKTGENVLDFSGFLQFLRQWSNEHLRRTRARELRCASEAGLSEGEMEDYRRLFEAGRWSVKQRRGSMPFGTYSGLGSPVVTADGIVEGCRQFRVAVKDHRTFIRDTIRLVSPQHFWLDDEQPAAPFPEFLLVLKALREIGAFD